MPVGVLASVVAPPLCWSCGGIARGREPLCTACRRAVRRLGPEPVYVAAVRAWAPVAYAGPARELVRALKFRGATAIADPLAAQIAASVPAGLVDPAAVLVPVPLHPRRRRKRGYNQAALVAEALARRTGLAVADCLLRTGDPATQVGRDRRRRAAGLAGGVELRPPPPEAALLVDDVVTTGATLAACAAALRAGGTRTVAAIAYARTIGR